MAAPPITVLVERNATGRHDYIVTAGRHYRAVIPQCDRDECRDGTLTECRTALNDRHQHDVRGSTSVTSWLKHTATHCHAWHDGRAQDFADALRKTYGKRMPRAVGTLRGRAHCGPMSTAHVAEALGVTVDAYRAELTKASERLEVT